MAFIDDAKDVLSADDFTTFENLQRKVIAFDTNSDEDKLFLDIKQKVKKALAERDRAKNLAFLKDGGYTIVEILKAMDITREQFNQAKAELFPNTPVKVENIATYPSGNFSMGDGRIPKELKQEILKGKEKAFVSHLTDFGKVWIREFNIPTQGPYKDEKIFKNVNAIVARLKFNKKVLLDEIEKAEKSESK